MSVALPILLVIAVWVVKHVVGELLSQQVIGSIPEFTARKAIRAAQMLPADLAKSYLEDWLAELHALQDRPLSALRFARGLAAAARVIAVMAGSPIRYTRPRLVAYRAVDIVGAALMLIVIAPVLAVVSILTRLAGPGPILVRRVQPGQAGRPYTRLTFATGLPHRSRRLMVQAIENASLNDLPALINVLRGDISFIGPPEESFWTGSQPLAVRPGIMSWEALARDAPTSLSIGEARARDQRRRIRDDLALCIHTVRVLVRDPHQQRRD